MKIALRLAWLVFVLLCAVAAAFYYDPLWVRDEHTRYQLWREGVASRYVSEGAYRLHYFEAAPPDGSAGTPLLLLHGLGDHAESWAPQIPALAHAGFHVYALDLLGYGRSDRPGVRYSIPLEVASVADFMHSIGLQHADVAGWSMGGWIAAELALDHPELVNRLILEDAAGIKFQNQIPRNLFTPTSEAGLNRLLKMLTPHPPAMPHFVARAALRRLAAGSRTVQSSMDAMTSGADLLDDRLGAIQQPTLIVWGSADRLLPISTGEQMHRGIPNSVFATITGCGHLAPAECATPVLDATIPFLKANPPMPSGEETLPGVPAD
jgi:pimeloyl-ACP methyl ester carboxylesterase